MTEKELRRLSRQDFLQLLMMQGTEMQALQTTLDETKQELESLRQSNERIKTRLDEKDALIERLKGRLDAKDATIRRLVNEIAKRQENRRIELNEAGSIAMAALKLNGVFEAAQKAADQYLYNLRLLTEAYGPLPVQAAQSPADPLEAEDEAQAAADAELERLLAANRQHDLQDRAKSAQNTDTAGDPA